MTDPHPVDENPEEHIGDLVEVNFDTGEVTEIGMGADEESDRVTEQLQPDSSEPR